MNIVMQVNGSDANRMTKTLTDVLTLSGYLRDQSSIMDPVIMLETSADAIAGCNYMYIPEFGRYYFIRDITSVRNNLTQVSAHVDVLTTYKDAILANTGIIRRQENDWNLYLDDGSFKVYNNPVILTRAFPSGFSSTSFILAVAGS